MDFHRLKELVGKLGGLLVFDGNEPSLVVLSYEKFKKLDASEEIPVSHGNEFSPVRSLARANGASPKDLGEATSNGVNTSIVSNGVQEDEDTVEKLNQEISALKEEIRQKEEAELTETEQTLEPTEQAVDPAPFLD